MTILGHPLVPVLLSVQCQAVARHQLTELGLSDAQVTWAVGREIDVAARGVFVARGSSDSWAQRLWVRRLQIDAPAAIFREAAAAVHGLESFRPGPVTFVVPHGWHRKLVGVHQTRDDFLSDTELFCNIPVTSPARTLCDLAATTGRARLRDAIDDAFARRLVQPEELVATFDALRRPGKPGFKRLGLILDDWRDGGRVPTRSVLERKTLELFRRFGGPAPIVGWEFPSRTELPHVADFGDSDALLVLETDGRRWHDRIKQKRRDIERDANAARHGIQVHRVLWEHVTGDPHGTWRTYMEIRSVRLRQLGRRAPTPPSGGTSADVVG